jgi:hypothetical protein
VRNITSQFHPARTATVARRGVALVTVGALALAIAGCGGSSTNGRNSSTNGRNSSTNGRNSSQIIGSWLGPAPNSAAAGCSDSKITYTFESGGAWAGHLDYASTCAGGGSFTVGGSYTFDGHSLVLRWTMCPESCPSDTTVTVSFVDQNSFSMSGVNGYYHRQ